MFILLLTASTRVYKYGAPLVKGNPTACDAGMAQLVEHLFCKQGVGGSSPSVSIKIETEHVGHVLN